MILPLSFSWIYLVLKVIDGISAVRLWQCGEECFVGLVSARGLHFDGPLVVRKLVDDVRKILLQFELLEGSNTVRSKANTIVDELIRAKREI